MVALDCPLPHLRAHGQLDVARTGCASVAKRQDRYRFTGVVDFDHVQLQPNLERLVKQIRVTIGESNVGPPWGDYPSLILGSVDAVSSIHSLYCDIVTAIPTIQIRVTCGTASET